MSFYSLFIGALINTERVSSKTHFYNTKMNVATRRSLEQLDQFRQEKVLMEEKNRKDYRN